jgi:hypothetical protein
MQRRSFLSGLVATGVGLWMLREPERVYSFIRRPTFPKFQPTLRIYGGTMPLDADAAISNLMLSEVPLSFKDGKWHGTDFAADSSGTVSFARLYGANGETILDMPRRSLGLNSGYVLMGAQIQMELLLDKRLEMLMI